MDKDSALYRALGSKFLTRQFAVLSLGCVQDNGPLWTRPCSVRCSVKSATTLCPRRGQRASQTPWLMSANLASSPNGVGRGLERAPFLRDLHTVKLNLRRRPREVEGTGAAGRSSGNTKTSQSVCGGVMTSCDPRLQSSALFIYLLCLRKCKKRAEWKVPRREKRLLLLQRVHRVMGSFTADKYFSPPHVRTTLLSSLPRRSQTKVGASRKGLRLWWHSTNMDCNHTGNATVQSPYKGYFL